MPKLPEMPLLLVVFKIFKPLILARPDAWKGACWFGLCPWVVLPPPAVLATIEERDGIKFMDVM